MMKINFFSKQIFNIIVLLSLVLIMNRCSSKDEEVDLFADLPEEIKRNWINENFWANRLEDWQLSNGRIECVNANLPNRTVHLLPYVISNDSGSIHLEIEIGTISKNDSLKINHYAGLLLGAGSIADDFKKRALIHGNNQNNTGIVVGVNGNGKIIFLDHENKGELINLSAAEEMAHVELNNAGILLQIVIQPEADYYTIMLSILDKSNRNVLSYAKVSNIDKKKIQGNIALIANGGADLNDASFWFDNLKMSGSKLKYNKNETLGPIIGAMYSYLDGKINLTAQLMPLSVKDNMEVSLEVSKYNKNQWKTIAKAQIDTLSYTARFTVNSLKTDLNYNYRVTYKLIAKNGKQNIFHFNGIIPKNKNNQNLIKVAFFKDTFFSNALFSDAKNNNNGYKSMFSTQVLTSDVLKQKADLLVFMGGQVNENCFEPASYSSFQDLKMNYLYKWYLWYFSFQKIIAHHPTLILTNNTDFFTEISTKNRKEYLTLKLKDKKDADNFIRLVEQTQLPNQALSIDDQKFFENQMFNYGKIQFGFLANSQKDSTIFPLSINNQIDTMPSEEDKFMNFFTLHWENTEMKTILTHFPILNTDSLNQQADNLKYPQNNVIAQAQKNFSVIISASENNSLLAKCGLKTFSDASYYFLTPALRSFSILKDENSDFFTKENQKIKILAKAEQKSNLKQHFLSYSIIKFNKFQKTINFENRTITHDNETNKTDIKNWNKTISVLSNFNEISSIYLPTFKIKGTMQTVTYFVYDNATKELIYTQRAKENIFKPKVFYWASYDVVFFDPVSGKKIILEKVYAKNNTDTSSVFVRF